MRLDYGWNDTATSIFCYTHYIILVQTLWQRLLSRSLSVCINLFRLAALCFVTHCVHMTCCIWTVITGEQEHFHTGRIHHTDLRDQV